MAKVIVLGTSNSIPDERHENTHLVVVGSARTILIDCVSTPIVRLQRAGVGLNQLTDLILTHFHPDHVSGVPLLLMDLWLSGRTAPLAIYGLGYTLERVERLMELYEWETWPNFFPVSFHLLPEEPLTPVLETEELRLWASPVKHLIPTIGLRFEFMGKGGKSTLAYSCDTEPCPEVVELSRGADILLHEATGATLGHSSAGQAGRVAQEAGVGHLYLIHYPTGPSLNGHLIDEAQSAYPGQVSLAEDFLELDFD